MEVRDTQVDATRLSRGRASWALLVLTVLVVAVPVVSAVRSVLKATGVLAVGRVDGPVLVDGFGSVETERDLRVVELYLSMVSVPLAVAGLVLLAGLLAWRPWAREGVMGLGGFVGVLLLLFSLAGLLSEQRGERAGTGVLAALVVLATAALAGSRGVRRDMDLRRIQREVRARG